MVDVNEIFGSEAEPKATHGLSIATGESTLPWAALCGPSSFTANLISWICPWRLSASASLMNALLSVRIDLMRHLEPALTIDSGDDFIALSLL
jgi:hypothetical protein